MPSPGGLTKEDQTAMLAWLAVMCANGNFSVKFKDEIEVWKKYQDEKKFSKKLDKQIKEEVDRFISGKKSNDDLIEEKFPYPEWYIEDNT